MTSHQPQTQRNNKEPQPFSSRAREPLAGDEEATTELRLGEFTGVPSLSLSEARLLINAVIGQRKKVHKRFVETETLLKMQDYLDVFARFKSKENIEAVERLLTAHTEFDSFEKSQLGTLCCEQSDEAKTLIPSIVSKISDVDLQELLDEISKLRQFTE